MTAMKRKAVRVVWGRLRTSSFYLGQLQAEIYR